MIENAPKKRTAWTILVFYFVIGFEIIYMISPFGVYYYSAYGTGLNFLNDYSCTAWLCAFFLPHIATTSSPVLNIVGGTGWVLAVLGFASFCFAALLVYYYKLAKKGAVTGGVYKYIRHPQYLSLIVCSFGLLLVWPRNIVLVMFVTVVSAYYFLAKAEEQECKAKFGQPFREYIARTGMFLPFGTRILEKLPALPRSGVKRYVAIFGIFLATLLTSVALTQGLRSWSAQALYTSCTDDSVIISLAEIEEDTLDRVTSLALSDPAVTGRMEAARSGSETRFVNYIMPAQWFMSDIPMNMNGLKGHHRPKDYDRNRYKVLVMKAGFEGDMDVRGIDLLLSIRDRYPLAEVTVDLAQRKVVGVENPPTAVRWGDIPTPLY